MVPPVKQIGFETHILATSSPSKQIRKRQTELKRIWKTKTVSKSTDQEADIIKR